MSASQLGMGVMINILSGNESTVKAFEAAKGKTIKEARLDTEANALRIQFEDDWGIKVFDDGQSCCENRYMRTDDDLTAFVGAQLLDVQVKDAPPLRAGEECEDYHDVQFLEVHTSKGVFTMSNHNEHNGYYGGFSVKIEVE